MRVFVCLCVCVCLRPCVWGHRCFCVLGNFGSSGSLCVCRFWLRFLVPRQRGASTQRFDFPSYLSLVLWGLCAWVSSRGLLRQQQKTHGGGATRAQEHTHHLTHDDGPHRGFLVGVKRGGVWGRLGSENGPLLLHLLLFAPPFSPCSRPRLCVCVGVFLCLCLCVCALCLLRVSVCALLFARWDLAPHNVLVASR
jgi:hypothetical protein